MEEEKNETANDLCDSLAISSATKGGLVKIYGNFDNVEAFKKKIENAKEVRIYAQSQIAVNI